MFGNRARDKAHAIVLAQNSDLKEQLREAEARIDKLLDRIMALTNMGALREVNRPLPKGPETPPSTATEEPPRANRFPGNEVLVAPTRLPQPPAPFTSPKPVFNVPPPAGQGPPKKVN